MERLIRRLRREVLDHVIVLYEWHLQRLLAPYFACYRRWRTHLSLAMDCPEPRPLQPPEHGKVLAVPEVGDSITIMSSRKREIIAWMQGMIKRSLLFQGTEGEVCHALLY